MHDKQVRRRRAVLALLVVASVLLLTAYFGESPTSPLHSVQRVVVGVLSPVQEGASKVLSPVRDIAGWVSSMIRAKSQNERLTRENTKLTQELAQARYDEIQFKHDQGLLKLDAIPAVNGSDPVAANVIGQNPSLWYQQVEVDKGFDEGVRGGDPVVAPGGLVGDVTELGSNWSLVTELTDDKFGAEAQVLDGPGDTGTLQPAVGNPNSLILGFLPAHDTAIAANDEVVTAGFQDSVNHKIRDLFPGGIPIGYVSNANPNTLISDQQVTVTPYVDLRHLTVVQILTHPTSTTASASLGAP